MKLVIDIPDNIYGLFKYLESAIKDYKKGNTVRDVLVRAIINGTPLPKGHGDLIDACEEMRLMRSYDYDTYEDYARAFDMLDNAPTVIKADKGETE